MEIDLDSYCVSIAAIAGIVILDGIALMNGIDGIAMSASIAAVAAIAGFKIGVQNK